MVYTTLFSELLLLDEAVISRRCSLSLLWGCREQSINQMRKYGFNKLVSTYYLLTFIYTKKKTCFKLSNYLSSYYQGYHCLIHTFIHYIAGWNYILFLTIRIGHHGCCTSVTVQSLVCIFIWTTTFFWLESGKNNHKCFQTFKIH